MVLCETMCRTMIIITCFPLEVTEIKCLTKKGREIKKKEERQKKGKIRGEVPLWV